MKRNLNFIEASSLLEANETTSVELTKIYLDNIKEAEELNCFNTITAEQALDDAEKSDLRRQQGKLKSQFDGIPIGCLLYTSPSPRDRTRSRMPSSA